MGEKLCQFAFRRITRVPFVVKKNETPDPIDIASFSTDTETLAPNNIARWSSNFGLF
jgi:hypothetical protein